MERYDPDRPRRRLGAMIHELRGACAILRGKLASEVMVGFEMERRCRSDESSSPLSFGFGSDDVACSFFPNSEIIRLPHPPNEDSCESSKQASGQAKNILFSC